VAGVTVQLSGSSLVSIQQGVEEAGLVPWLGGHVSLVVVG